MAPGLWGWFSFCIDCILHHCASLLMCCSHARAYCAYIPPVRLLLEPGLHGFARGWHLGLWGCIDCIPQHCNVTSLLTWSMHSQEHIARPFHRPDSCGLAPWACGFRSPFCSVVTPPVLKPWKNKGEGVIFKGGDVWFVFILCSRVCF